MFGKEFIKKNFYFSDDNFLYFNHGTFGICPKPVLEAKINILRKMETNPCLEYATTMFDGCLENTKLLGDRIGVNYKNLAITTNVTQGFYSVLQSLEVTPGQEILLTNFTYEAVRMEVEDTLVNKGLTIRTLTLSAPFRSNAEITDLYVQFVLDHPQIKYAIIDHIPSALPMVQPVRDIVAALRPLGVFTIIDGAHTPGHLKDLSIAHIDPDVYVGNLHKWYFLPRGTGFIALRDGSTVQVKPPVVSFLFKRELYLRFVFMGTSDFSNVLCVKEAFHFVDMIGGLEGIHPVIVDTLEKGVSYLESCWNVKSLSFPENAPFMRLVPLPSGFDRHKADIARVARITFQRDYYCNTLEKCNFAASMIVIDDRLYFRLACHIYVTYDHFVLFADRVQQWLEQLDTDGGIIGGK